MKRIILLIFLLLLLSACKEGKPSTPTPSAIAPIPSVLEEKSVITDIANWQHPVKEVLERNNVKITKLELTQNKTYPTFYVQIPNDLPIKDYACDLLEPISEANAYWDYTLVDEKQKITIDVKNDKDKQLLISYSINGNKNDLQDFSKVQSEYIKYAKFLYQNEKVFNFIKEDIDLDGRQEIVITLGKYNNPYVLRENGNTLTKIGSINGGVYTVIDVNLVQMKDKNQKYIYIRVSNTANLYGFGLYEIDSNKLKRIAYSASPTGAGDDKLTSSTKNDVYDGYIQNRWSYDVSYLNTSRYYSWNGNGFDKINIAVNVRGYPTSPQDVVEQYVRLSMLFEDDKKSLNVVNRLYELNFSNKNLDSEKIDGITNILFISNQFETKVNGDLAEVTMKVKNKSTVFMLKSIGGKWQITDIQGDFVISKN